jgi:hypothetical protein
VDAPGRTLASPLGQAAVNAIAVSRRQRAGDCCVAVR